MQVANGLQKEVFISAKCVGYGGKQIDADASELNGALSLRDPVSPTAAR